MVLTHTVSQKKKGESREYRKRQGDGSQIGDRFYD